MRVDLAIVGAGTAGAALAGFAAARGLRVVCLERRKATDAGARWVNGVPAWAFERAGLSRPRGPELFGDGHAVHLIAGSGPRRVTVPRHDVLEVDMRHLVERLQRSARDCGAELFEDTRVTGFDGRALETTRGPISARWFVDASGLAGARLLGQPRVHARDICVAAQEVRAVRDVGAARAFFERHAVSVGDTACFTGLAGGFSVLNLRLSGDRLGILTGSIPGEGHASGGELLRRFVDDHAFVGERCFGGARAIPLSRPRDLLARDNVAVLGDAACQVFSAHGSGIGAGLLAARLLADVVAAERPLHEYAVKWHRTYGPLFATFEAFRRFSQRLSAAELERMMEVGLLDVHGARAGLEQRLPAPSPGVAARALRGAVADRRLGLAIAGVLSRGAVAAALYRRYPDDPAALPEWSRSARRLLG
jgi:flavin-dependent dehydrogenase